MTITSERIAEIKAQAEEVRCLGLKVIVSPNEMLGLLARLRYAEKLAKRMGEELVISETAYAPSAEEPRWCWQGSGEPIVKASKATARAAIARATAGPRGAEVKP